jgi:hypothetical protein
LRKSYSTEQKEDNWKKRLSARRNKIKKAKSRKRENAAY